MKQFFDTEFIDNPDYLALLSIGIVREDGQKYYAELDTTDRSQAVPWVQKNVIHLLNGPVKTRNQICYDIKEFVGIKPEFWGYFVSFDWVLLSRLYGSMLSVPPSWPNYAHDLLNIKGKFKLLKQITVQHHALNDAEWTKENYEYLIQQRAWAKSSLELGNFYNG